MRDFGKRGVAVFDCDSLTDTYPGFPDLLLLRKDHGVLFELKYEDGGFTTYQPGFYAKHKNSFHTYIVRWRKGRVWVTRVDRRLLEDKKRYDRITTYAEFLEWFMQKMGVENDSEKTTRW